MKSHLRCCTEEHPVDPRARLWRLLDDLNAAVASQTLPAGHPATVRSARACAARTPRSGWLAAADRACIGIAQVAALANDEHHHCLRMGCHEMDFMNRYSKDAFMRGTQRSPDDWEEEWHE